MVSNNRNGVFTVVRGNSAPRFTYVQPVDENVSMKEGENKIFVVTAVDDDNDPLSFNWFFDGNNVLSNQNVFVYTADYNSSGQHDVNVVVSDGTIAVSRHWLLNIIDVFRMTRLPSGSIKRILPFGLVGNTNG